MQGIIALRLDPELIDAIVSSRDGMGQTGESYLLAFDKEKARFEFRTTVQTTGNDRWMMGTTIRPLDYWEKARSNSNGGIGQYTDSSGSPVLVAYDELNILNLEWYLFSKVNHAEVVAPIRLLGIDIAALSFFLVLFVGIGALLFANNFTAPILKAKELAQSIASGQLDVEIKTDHIDELGDLSRALDTMAHRLREYDWLKSGTEQLDDSLRGEHDPAQLAWRLLAFMIGHFQVPLGAVYLTRGDARVLSLSARHGWTDRDGERLTSIGFGDGMIGQAAETQTPLFFDTTDPDAPVLDYGTGEAKPSSFAAIPLVFEGTTLGVMLLAGFSRFDKTQRHFLDETCGNIGVLLAAAESHQTIEALLKRAKKQENDLRINNAELQRQAQALIESERELQTQQEELQSQQEELRVTNEELEGRTQELEIRSKAIQQKNDELTTARDEIRQKVKDLETANKYKSEFLANMSHELRTPLNSILILSQLMAENRGNSLSARQVESARTINASGSDLLKLINDILDLSKVEAGKIDLTIEEMPINGFVADLERVFRPVSENRGIPFAVTIADDIPQVLMTDSHRLQQVVRNLLSNAFKFTKPGGQVGLLIAHPQAADLPAGCELAPETAVAFVVTD